MLEITQIVVLNQVERKPRPLDMEPGSPLVLQSTSWEGDTIYSWLYLRTFSRLFLASLEMY